MMSLKYLLLLCVELCMVQHIYSQRTKDTSGYRFTMIKEIKATPVKDQGETSTCWSFSTISLLESEILKDSHTEYDLSEMFVVMNIWKEKAVKYLRLHGNMNFTGGGLGTDVLLAIRKYGIVPDQVYTGLLNDSEQHNHKEFDLKLKTYVSPLSKSQSEPLSRDWIEGFEHILKSQLGKTPEYFRYKGKDYTPTLFAADLGINIDDYVLLSSFTHHPFYSSFILEVPDNWSYVAAYNLPLNELIEVMDSALMKNYSISLATDYSERGFSFSKGLAIFPESIVNGASYQKIQQAFSHPSKEVEVTQELRQAQFDNFQTTDDHGMHIVGLAKDQTGKKFYYVKNSWGTNNMYNGYMFVSKAYMQLKTISILLNKKGIPLNIRQKLGI